MKSFIFVLGAFLTVHANAGEVCGKVKKLQSANAHLTLILEDGSQFLFGNLDVPSITVAQIAFQSGKVLCVEADGHSIPRLQVEN